MPPDATAPVAVTMTRQCAFCAVEMPVDAKKCKQCGEFVTPAISVGVGVIFAVGVMIACVLAGMQPGHSEGVIAVGVWAIFALLFAETFARAYPHWRL